ncbi:MAG: DUF1275 domain-containing protein [Caldilineaceae bacterium]|nr:DUF1275 domain-containing protein [Caldilineaceae bacterium]
MTLTRTVAASAFAQRQVLLVLLLALTGGSVNAVMVMGFGVLAGAQTGNTIMLASALAQGQLATAIYAIISVSGYITGAALGEIMLVRQREDARGLSALGQTFLAELGALSCLLIGWHWAGTNLSVGASISFVTLAALAMGLQSIAVVHLRANPTTTYVTGTLMNFTTRFVRWLKLVETEQPHKHKAQESAAQLSLQDGPWFHAMTLLAYGGSAVVGGLGFLYWADLVLLFPILVLGTVISGDYFVERLTREGER